MPSTSPRESPQLMPGPVVVTGAAGAVGLRVARRLALHHPEVEVRAVDKVHSSWPDVDVKQIDLTLDDLTATFAGASTVVHLATAVTPDLVDPTAEELELAILSRVLDAAAEVRVAHVVVLSSAMVYGAWDGNPVPLTEDVEVRPNRDFPWAMARAAVERAAREWGTRNDVAVTVLRPTSVVADDMLGQLARTLHTAGVGIAAEGDPVVQYLHVDDLASAITVALASRFDGIVNVAPDGWIQPEGLADLEGPKPRLKVPAWAARALAALRSWAGLSPIPPGIVPYTSHSWVVANDRIRSLGWVPEFTNEEAWVVSHQPNPIEKMPARKRQELALAVAGLAGVGLLVGAAVLISRLRRR